MALVKNMDPGDVRKKLTDPAALALFDTFAALGPRWDVDDTPGGVRIMPALSVKSATGSRSHYAPSYDTWLRATPDKGMLFQQKLIDEAAREDRIVIVNGDDKNVFAWDAATSAFTPARIVREPVYTRLSPQEGRSKLSTDFARAAFDEMNALGPAWLLEERDRLRGPVETALIPLIRIFDSACKFLGAVNTGMKAANCDDSVTEERAALKQKASAPGSMTVVTADTGTKTVLSYDAGANTFTPRPMPPRRQGCCRTGCGTCMWGKPG